MNGLGLSLGGLRMGFALCLGFAVCLALGLVGVDLCIGLGLEMCSKTPF
jgi:hypothetical protein